MARTKTPDSEPEPLPEPAPRPETLEAASPAYRAALERGRQIARHLESAELQLNALGPTETPPASARARAYLSGGDPAAMKASATLEQVKAAREQVETLREASRLHAGVIADAEKNARAALLAAWVDADRELLAGQLAGLRQFVRLVKERTELHARVRRMAGGPDRLQPIADGIGPDNISLNKITGELLRIENACRHFDYLGE
jgi:hypothetical protein